LVGVGRRHVGPLFGDQLLLNLSQRLRKTAQRVAGLDTVRERAEDFSRVHVVALVAGRGGLRGAVTA
jgi:hypothetical protein